MAGKRGSYAKSELRKQAISEAALALIMERGHRAVTVAEVADRAGVSEPSVFYHFPTKEALLVAALRQSTWGWDYPILAMTAAELGHLDRAIEALLWESPKNVFLANGHSPQMGGFLSVYLPSNGALLAAVAHIVRAHRAGPELPAGWVMRYAGFAPDEEPGR